jgi:glutathione synthase/RimK-type ligase-like ATP-grasp enzyme
LERGWAYEFPPSSPAGAVLTPWLAMKVQLNLKIRAQPDNATCGPTCLHALYGYYGEQLPLDQVIAEVPSLATGGTLGVMLASVNHHTFRFSRRAVAEGLVVIDDPESVLKCTNKVYLAELLDRKGLLAPRTLIVHRDNVEEIVSRLGLPCILKKPDSAFSQGVVKVDTRDEVQRVTGEMLEGSDLVIAQEFLPTPFDWRIGVIDGRALYACRYYMAASHWQIIRRNPDDAVDYGRVETLPVELAPFQVVRTAVKAANLIGEGLYGVDVKQIGRRCYVIEVNDNPTIQSGIEDAVLKDALYDRIMEVFLRRLEHRRQGLPP